MSSPDSSSSRNNFPTSWGNLHWAEKDGPLGGAPLKDKDREILRAALDGEVEMPPGVLWPHFSSAEVDTAERAIRVLRDTIPSDETATRRLYGDIVDMLIDYREACRAEEAMQRQKHEAQLIDVGREQQREDWSGKFGTQVAAQAQLLFEEMKRNERRAKRRDSRNAKKGAGRG